VLTLEELILVAKAVEEGRVILDAGMNVPIMKDNAARKLNVAAVILRTVIEPKHPDLYKDGYIELDSYVGDSENGIQDEETDVVASPTAEVGKSEDDSSEK